MAKLKRTSNSKRPQAIEKSANPRQSNPTLLVGLLLAVAVGVLFWIFTSRIQETVQIVTAKSGIPAFSTITDNDLNFPKVAKDSVDPSDLTFSEYQQLKQKTIVNRVEILAGQRISKSAISAASLGSLSVVSSSERVVAVNASFQGAAAGTVVPGSVADVYVGNKLVVPNAKILAIGSGPDATSNLRPDSKVKNQEGTGIIVILAVTPAQAATLLGTPQVSLAYNPHLTFDSKGRICKVGQCESVIQSGANINPSNGDVTGTQSGTPDTTNPSTTAPQTQSTTPQVDPNATTPSTQQYPAPTTTTPQGG